MLLISDSHRFIFVHVRKAAGSAITQVLRPLALQRQRSARARLFSRAGLIRDYRRRAFRIHEPLRGVQRCMPPVVFQGYFKFGFVRCPWERLISEYEFIRGFPRHPRHRRVAAMDFPAFIRFQAGRADAYQYPMFLDTSDQPAADFIGRFEHLQDDFDRVCDRIGIDRVALPHRNVGSRQELADYYDEEAIELVGRIWARDIEHFGYAAPDLNIEA